jgi:serine/threonine-protein kinase RsbW
VSIPLNDTGRPRLDTGTDPEVHLVIPASSRYLRLARLTAAGLAGDLGYPVDAIEDLRIAVDELCAAIIEDTAIPTTLELTYREAEGSLVVEGTCRARSTNAPDLHSVARELLNMLADEYSIGAIDGHRNFRLVKYAEVTEG